VGELIEDGKCLLFLFYTTEEDSNWSVIRSLFHITALADPHSSSTKKPSLNAFTQFSQRISGLRLRATEYEKEDAFPSNLPYFCSIASTNI
jgi:hypothetical protein